MGDSGMGASGMSESQEFAFILLTVVIMLLMWIVCTSGNIRWIVLLFGASIIGMIMIAVLGGGCSPLDVGL